ncbi:hypothetical protein [Acinetobacter haemolyticus]|uniref:PGAP1-like alpha/beta domain-containing protein n=1 Tax=Acinetobacter haemolyticus TaxID=29430 RepID=UPI003D225601
MLFNQYAYLRKSLSNLCIIETGFFIIESRDAAAKDAVLIGHSMGGIISRFTCKRCRSIETSFSNDDQPSAKHSSESILLLVSD